MDGGGAARVQVRLFGPVEVEVDGRPLSVDTRKAVALLAFLAAERGPASRDRLAALLWPEAAPARALGALRRTLSVLRSGVGGVGVIVTRAAVALDPASVDVDLSRFADALARARRHAHEGDAACESCRASLAEAAGIARGPFMDGFGLRDSEEFDQWQLAEAEHLRGQLAGVLERLARSSLAAGDSDAAIGAVDRWLAVDPLHEPAHRLAMAAHAAAGETAAAIARYRSCVRVLDAELGVAPLVETTALYEAIRTGAATEPGRPGGGARPGAGVPSTPPLVARDAEIDALVAAWERITADGRLMVIEGEAGIGKSRLLDALADRVSSAGGAFARASCHAGERGLPFAVAATLLREAAALPGAMDRIARLPAATRTEVARFLPGVAWPEEVAGSGKRRAPADPTGMTRLLEALCDALAVALPGPVPGLLAVEDLQWADDSSVGLVAYLARRLVRRPFALAVSWRREELDGRALWFSLESRRAAASMVRLERLSPAESLELARAIAGDIHDDERLDDARLESVAAESEGLPLFAVAALAPGRSAAGALPAGVAALQRERLAAVGGVTAQVLTTAAVLGRSFDLATIRAVSGRGEDEVVAALDELRRLGIVRYVPGLRSQDVVLDFTHQSLRSVAYEDASLARRRLLHRRAADAFRTGRGGQVATDWGLIARHELAGGREIEAADAYRRAGDAARDILAHREAIEAYRAALALGARDVASIGESIGEIEAAVGDYAGAVADLEAAAAAAAEGSTAGRLASIEGHLGRVHLFRGDLDAAASHLDAALAMVGESGSTERAGLLAERASVASRAGDHGLARRLAADALAAGPEAGDAAAHALRVLGMAALFAGSTSDARDRLEQSLALASRSNDLAASIAARNALALLHAAMGRTAEAAALAREAAEAARLAGYTHLEAAVENNLADILHAAGDEAGAREHQRRAVALFADVAGWTGGLEPELWKLVAW